MYHQISPKEIIPHGWLRRQLELQANGLAGNLDKVWPDVAQSAWIGGNRESWERVPYWLDGFIPLAYLLRNDDLIARADFYMNAIMDRQQADGWICPCAPEAREKYDIWAFFLIGKVFALYCEFTGNARAEDSLLRAMKCLDNLRRENKLVIKNWGKFRWFECLIPLQYLYDRYHEEWMRELARHLRNEGTHYPELTDEWKRPLNKWTYGTHIVNLAMMLKYEAVSCTLFEEPATGETEKLWQLLDEYNGTAVGTFAGDECLAGRKNNRGTELCSVVELMYSCELLYSVTGNNIWADRLEKIAFNALPAAISDDMWTHQYDQMVNQIACETFPAKAVFGTNGKDAHLFGLEPHFGCCTANFGQGWPKLTLGIWRRENDTLTCGSMLPCELNTKIQDVDVRIRIDSDYPFRHTARYIVETNSAVAFTLGIRIPAWATTAVVDGKSATPGSVFPIRKEWNGKTEFTVEFSATVREVPRPFGLSAVEYGPLVFAFPIKSETQKLEYEKNGVVREFPYCDYEWIPQSEWRYGISSVATEPNLCDGDNVPFSSIAPRVTLDADLCRIAWDYEEGYETVSAYCPENTIPLCAPEHHTLVPYGCAKLRMTEMPKIKSFKK